MNELERARKAIDKLEELVETYKEHYNFYNQNMGYISTIKQALTPPTSEEVCEALSEYYERKVFYNHDKYNNGFHFKDSWYIVKFENNELHFILNEYFKANDLPLRILGKIVRFYEAQE